MPKVVDCVGFSMYLGDGVGMGGIVSVYVYVCVCFGLSLRTCFSLYFLEVFGCRFPCDWITRGSEENGLWRGSN